MQISWLTLRSRPSRSKCRVSASMGRRKSSVRCLGVYDGASHTCWGFALLELVVVIAILGILAGIAIPVYITFIEKARVVKAISEIKHINTGIDAYRVENVALPASLNDVGYQDLLDPWGNPYQYYNIEANGTAGARMDAPGRINTDYDLLSKGKDGETNKNIKTKKSSDDIIRADNGSYIGLASRY